MASVVHNWKTDKITVPGGTVVDHADVALMFTDNTVAQEQLGSPGSGLPTQAFFDNLAAGDYKIRGRCFDQNGLQLGPDAFSDEFNVAAPDEDVIILVSGGAPIVTP